MFCSANFSCNPQTDVGTSKLGSLAQRGRIGKLGLAVAARATDRIGEEGDFLDDPTCAVERPRLLGLWIALARRYRDALGADAPRADHRADFGLGFRLRHRTLEIHTPERLDTAARYDLHVVRRAAVRLELIVRPAVGFETPRDETTALTAGRCGSGRGSSVKRQTFDDLAERPWPVARRSGGDPRNVAGAGHSLYRLCQRVGL